MRKEAVPIVRLSYGIPGPIRFFRIAEDDSGTLVFLVGLTPDIIVPLLRASRGLTSRLKPRMLIGCMIYHQLDHYLEIALMSRRKERLKILHRAVA